MFFFCSIYKKKTKLRPFNDTNNEVDLGFKVKVRSSKEKSGVSQLRSDFQNTTKEAEKSAIGGVVGSSARIQGKGNTYIYRGRATEPVNRSAH